MPSETKNTAADLKSGLVVFLIALPLSIGIALASGAPPTAGLISAVVGGLLGAYLGGGHVTINGPAAGLIAVVLSAIQALAPEDAATGFRRFLACLIVAGALQIFAGVFRMGKYVSQVPSSVVRGMLASIGLIIMIKQSYVFLGLKPSGNILHSLFALPAALGALDVPSTIIGVAGLAVMIFLASTKIQALKRVPAPLVVVILGTGLALWLGHVSTVSVPTQLSEFFVTPQFDAITSGTSVLVIISVFFVASLESVLSASAVDQLDPLARETNFDRELWSKGVCNLVCGLVGGLPIIAEIVRSSANIASGARTPLANFTHGALILLFVVAMPSVLNQIPLSALAAILIMVGFRLAHPKQFVELFHLGPVSFIAFCVTIIGTLAEDLLVGIFAGILVKAIAVIVSGVEWNDLWSVRNETKANGEMTTLSFSGALYFAKALKVRSAITECVAQGPLVIDLNEVSFLDPTVAAIVERQRGIRERQGLKTVVVYPTRFAHVKNALGH